jgi:starch synthase
MARNPRILIVTPEITYLPDGMGNATNHMRAKAGGLADVSASLVSALFELGADVHVALPHYRRMFNVDVGRLINDELRIYKRVLPDSRIHLAQDRIFYYQNEVYSSSVETSRKLALVFQREVINNIIPNVNPDLIHCNDWMTGLIPAMARRHGIPSLFTVHNIHSQELTLAEIEDAGIDAAEFWQSLFYRHYAGDYESVRYDNPVNMLASAIFGAHFVNTVSPTFLHEICDGQHDFVPPAVRSEMTQKLIAGCASGILNAPDPSFDPATDPLLSDRFDVATHVEGKRQSKLHLQERLGLAQNPDAPMLFWPSRLDPVQKGCQLLADILYNLVLHYGDEQLQVVFVATGPFQIWFRGIVDEHQLHDRVAVYNFDEQTSHQAYAASDFMLMPSMFEPCGLPQMVSARYGSLPIVHDTGGLHDTVSMLDVAQSSGNGFLFETYDSHALWWAIERAMDFYRLPAEIKAAQIGRIMRESAERFTHANTAREYINIYERMLERTLVDRKPGSVAKAV